MGTCAKKKKHRRPCPRLADLFIPRTYSATSCVVVTVPFYVHSVSSTPATCTGRGKKLKSGWWGGRWSVLAHLEYFSLPNFGRSRQEYLCRTDARQPSTWPDTTSRPIRSVRTVGCSCPDRPESGRLPKFPELKSREKCTWSAKDYFPIHVSKQKNSFYAQSAWEQVRSTNGRASNHCADPWLAMRGEIDCMWLSNVKFVLSWRWTSFHAASPAQKSTV